MNTIIHTDRLESYPYAMSKVNVYKFNVHVIALGLWSYKI